jgi:tRNA-specific 2-thiouridylase
VGGRWVLERAADRQKDQSYFLFTLGQAELADIVFPVGELTKAEVREVARRHRLPTSAKPESMEICFVPDGDYAGFVEKVAGPQPPGEIVSPDGRVLGTHAGVHRFTVGQRRGLNVSSAEPLYVQRLDAAAGRVVVGPAAEAERARFEVLRPHWVSREAPAPDAEVEVKIRHRHPGAAARVARATPEKLEVELRSPARAVTPGQAAVFYEGERVLGGGWIA